MKDTVRLLADRVANLENYCCVSLLNEALKVWYGNLELSQIPGSCISCACGVYYLFVFLCSTVAITSLTEMTAVSNAFYCP